MLISGNFRIYVTIIVIDAQDGCEIFVNHHSMRLTNGAAEWLLGYAVICSSQGNLPLISMKEGWKDGRMEGWKDRRIEGRKEERKKGKEERMDTPA